MPIAPTYPGVYIEEVPSGVRTITGVATSITAFIGRTKRGPVNEPKTIFNYGDFERLFGGLWVKSTLGYAVKDFYMNGGSQAIIVRLESGASRSQLALDDLDLEAIDPGSWGNSLRARVEYEDNEAVLENIEERYGLDADDVFNLTIYDEKTGDMEKFINLTVIDENHVRAVDKVLENESALVRVKGALPNERPTNHRELEPGEEDVWEDNLGDADAVLDPTNSKVEAAGNGTDGGNLVKNDFTGVGMQGGKEGLFALQKVDLFNLLCIPPHSKETDIESGLIGEAAAYCEKKRAFFIIDAPDGWDDNEAAKSGLDALGTKSKNAALFFPRLKKPNSELENRIENFAPCGAVAGIFARTDASRGIWKAAAGIDASLIGVPQLSVPLTDAENGMLNPLGINCLRTRPAVGRVVWGARTLKGDDRIGSEWKYIPVRRLALYIEESLYRGTQWVVFEPNDEPLWSQVRLNLGAFMHNLFRQGAFQGSSPKDAYFVKCSGETTTQTDINLGIVNIHVGFAPLKPAEFVIIKIQQIAGQVAS